MATLTAAIGSGDLSFTLTSATEWLSDDGNPLGEDGPFVTVIDRGLATEEKILCSGVNPASGVVTVYDVGGFSGRGYDGTAAVGHTPLGGSPQSGACMVTLTSVETNEFNAAANFLFGLSPVTGDVPVWTAEGPQWQGGGGGGGTGSIVHQQQYAPTTTAEYALSNTAPPVAVDPVHLTYAFTVPASGQLRIVATIPNQMIIFAGQDIGLVAAFTQHGTTTRVTPRRFLQTTDDSGTAALTLTLSSIYDSGIVTGLTPGAAVQWDLAGECVGGAGQFFADDGNTGTNAYGPILVTIYEA